MSIETKVLMDRVSKIYRTLYEIEYQRQENEATTLETEGDTSDKPSHVNISDNDINLLRNENDHLNAKIAELEQQLLEAKQNTTLNDEDILLYEIDPRTRNNFMRLLLTTNEMAIAKQGKHLHIGEKFSSKNLEGINIEIEKLGYKQIGERGYQKLMKMINEIR